MSLIELGLIDGNFFNADHVNQIEAAINSCAPAGTMRMTIAIVAESGWLLLNGQVVINAQSLYPDLWSVSPVAWKSGATLNLPNMASRLPIGQDATHATGAVGGSNTKAIAEANLPPHHHTMSHTHPVHTHSGTTGNQNQHHTHAPGNYGAGDQFVVQRLPGPNAFQITPGTGATISSYTGTSIELDDGSGNGGNHAHNFGTGNNSADTFSGNTADTGSATALDITPAWLAINFMIKAN